MELWKLVGFGDIRENGRSANGCWMPKPKCKMSDVALCVS
jgi:hypothetical protein